MCSTGNIVEILLDMTVRFQLLDWFMSWNFFGWLIKFFHRSCYLWEKRVQLKWDNCGEYRGKISGNSHKKTVFHKMLKYISINWKLLYAIVKSSKISSIVIFNINLNKIMRQSQGQFSVNFNPWRRSAVLCSLFSGSQLSASIKWRWKAGLIHSDVLYPFYVPDRCK